MLFTSGIFLAFFLIYYLVRRSVPHRYQLAWVVLGGSLFYSYWKPAYAWIPYALLLVAYLGGAWVSRMSAEGARRVALWATLLSLLLPLLIFKYFNFISGEVLRTSYRIDATLPLGVSFITFSAIAYVVDVYRRRFSPVKTIGPLAGMIFFFPHLIAGPILRPAEFIPQLKRVARAEGARLWVGVALFAIGILKKMVFADSIAEEIDPFFSPLQPAQPWRVWESLLALYGFAIQGYCDFSAYTDMAIGLGIMLGIRLPSNFDRPYAATSLVDFWRRWHQTLTRWFRDYIYIPLGGNRQGPWREAMAVFATTGISGLWHGASWTYLFWGLIHGAGIAMVHLFRSGSRAAFAVAIPRWVGWMLTFHFVALALILFRSPRLSIALSLYRGFFNIAGASASEITAFCSQHVFTLILLSLFAVTHRWDSHRIIRKALARMSVPVYVGILALIALLAIGIGHSGGKFIYFDF